ncbi:hypothetical protein RJT34_33444 [Clitoria ternatea]|uniref:Uncharacterized protein n=1 Tax=Clitoria ternatea TaxID=43366 RepID=A0AAN9EZY8_CLITE
MNSLFTGLINILPFHAPLEFVVICNIRLQTWVPNFFQEKVKEGHARGLRKDPTIPAEHKQIEKSTCKPGVFQNRKKKIASVYAEALDYC